MPYNDLMVQVRVHRDLPAARILFAKLVSCENRRWVEWSALIELGRLAGHHFRTRSMESRLASNVEVGEQLAVEAGDWFELHLESWAKAFNESGGR